MLKQSLDAHIPEKKITITLRPNNPWFSDELNQLKRAMRSLERRWVRNKCDENWVDYKELRNIYCRKLRQAKKTAISNKVQEIGSDARKLCKLIDKVLGKKKVNPLPDGESNESLSEDFAEFFLDKISKLRAKLDDKPTYNPNNRQIDKCLREFELASPSEVCKHMHKLRCKKSALDPLPVDIYKECVELLVGVTTHIINTSLQEHTFPLKWKEALIKPLMKKHNLPCEMKNYWPVSNLSIISKLTEKVVLDQLIKHLDKNAPLPQYQSTYRKWHSTETALLDFMDSVLWGFEKQEITIVCVMDLSAAFDMVDHNLLETTLHRRYGIHEVVLEWIDSYLRPRGYRVLVNDAKSSHKDTPFSVPQGSCLGPYLYLAYASTLEDIIEDSQVKITGFADDHTLRKTCKPTKQDQECTVRCLEHNLSKIKKWMDEMKLCMNTSKTEIIVFGSGVQLHKVSFDQLSVAGDEVLRTSCIKYLGVHMDGELKLHKHQRSVKLHPITCTALGVLENPLWWMHVNKWFNR